MASFWTMKTGCRWVGRLQREGKPKFMIAKFEGDDRAFVSKVFQDDTSVVDLESLWSPNYQSD